MTLYRLLLLAMVLLIGSLSCSSLWLYLHGSQAFLNQQLSVHAQDTATSLGLSLSPVLGADDWVLAGSMADSIFDRGEYQYVAIRSLDQRQSIERLSRASASGSPRWFRHLFPLNAPVERSQVNARWRLVADVEVQASVVRAYDYLWQISRKAMLFSAALALVSALVGAWILRQLLQPLQLVERQARGLRRHHYIKQASLPRVRELRSLVQTMNVMVDHSEAMFKEQCRRMERLRAQSLLDEQTGLGNLARGRKRLAQLLKDAELGDGMIAKVHLVGLDKVALKSGVDAELSLLRAVATRLSEWVLQLPHARVYRVGFADFMLLFPGIGAADLASLETEVRQRISIDLQQAGGDRVLIVACGYPLNEAMEVVEGRLEHQLSLALTQDQASVYLCDSGAELAPLDLAMQEQQLTQLLSVPPRLMLQPVFDRTGQTLHQEVLARFNDGQRWINPGPVMAMVARQRCHQQLDLLVLENILRRLRLRPQVQPVTCNLTAESVLDPLFLGQLRRRMSGHWQAVGFEVPERAFLVDPQLTQRFLEALQDNGARIWLDHTTPAGMVLMAKPGLHGIKLDPAYTRSLLSEEGHTDLIEMMIGAAHTRGIKVVAEQVEEAALAERLWQLGIDGVQGFAVRPPKPFSSEDGPVALDD
ncbi:EAL domain-containing protein [Ferrimonas pelagia]|uniref:LapD/MoxY N-terminal periplasmic domain-containing protein n=1 Tax=Ferrimonas pelagia TaxID=1177826 RepID=A0ABP9F4D2_9GAMM